MGAIFFLSITSFAGVAHATDSAWGWRAAASYNEPNQDGLFYLGPARTESLGEAYLTYARGGFYFHGTGYVQQHDGFETVRKGVVNELYLDGKWADWDLTVGKKRLGWGVGFGFRPLDVIVAEPRRALIPPAPEGLPMVVAEKFDATRAYTFLCGNDFETASGHVESGGNECAARYFSTDGALDIEALVHTADDVDYEVGADAAWVVSDELEVHGAALYQRHYRKPVNTLAEQGGAVLAATDPVKMRNLDGGLKTLLGATYTSNSGHSVMLEAWYDRAGFSAGEWRRLRELTQAQRDLLDAGMAPAPAVFGNIAYSTQTLARANLMQRNVLLRWSYDGESFDPAFDILYTPDDRGLVATASARHALGATYTLDYGIRYYGGATESIYRALPTRGVAFVTFASAFNW